MTEEDEAERLEAVEIEIRRGIHQLYPDWGVEKIQLGGEGSYHRVFKVTLADSRRVAVRLQWPEDRHSANAQRWQTKDFEGSQFATSLYLHRLNPEIALQVYGFWKSEIDGTFVSVVEWVCCPTLSATHVERLIVPQIDGKPLREHLYQLSEDQRNSELEKLGRLLLSIYAPTDLHAIGSLYLQERDELVVKSGHGLDIAVGPMACIPMPGERVVARPVDRGPFNTPAAWLSALTQGYIAYQHEEQRTLYNDRIFPIRLILRLQDILCHIAHVVDLWVYKRWVLHLIRTCASSNTAEIYRLDFTDLGVHNIMHVAETGHYTRHAPGALVVIDLDGTKVLPEWMIDLQRLPFKFSDDEEDEAIAPSEALTRELASVLERGGMKVCGDAGRKLRDLYVLANRAGGGHPSWEGVRRFVAQTNADERCSGSAGRMLAIWTSICSFFAGIHK